MNKEKDKLRTAVETLKDWISENPHSSHTSDIKHAMRIIDQAHTSIELEKAQNFYSQYFTK